MRSLLDEVITGILPARGLFMYIRGQMYEVITPGGVVAVRSVSVRERLLRFLLGEKRKLTILVPGDTVSGIEIQDVKEDEQEHEAL